MFLLYGGGDRPKGGHLDFIKREPKLLTAISSARELSCATFKWVHVIDGVDGECVAKYDSRQKESTALKKKRFLIHAHSLPGRPEFGEVKSRSEALARIEHVINTFGLTVPKDRLAISEVWS